MSTLSRILYPENVFLDLEAVHKKDFFSRIALMLSRQHRIEQGLITQQLNAREALGTTALGCGVAIPHARIATLHSPMAAFTRLRTPIAFDAPDEIPVSLIFMLLLPFRTTYEHVQMLADATALLCDDNFRKRLSVAESVRAIQACFHDGHGCSGNV